MRIIIKFILRVLFMPFTVGCLLITALLEFMMSDPDWGYWRSYNTFFIDLMPWSKY